MLDPELRPKYVNEDWYIANNQKIPLQPLMII